MVPENLPIIADGLDAQADARAWRYAAALALLIGGWAAWHYARLGLTLSHYDARAHLVVARRVIDSLTPGWRQFGAVWLPLPHVLNVIPVQWDWSARTGFSGVAISVVALSAGLGALAAYLRRVAGSLVVAVAVPLAILLNPNVLYLQATPMTEALLFGAAFLSLLAVDNWTREPAIDTAARAALPLTALVLTRYEGWLIAGALGAIAFLASRRPRSGFLLLAGSPVAAIAAFLVLSYLATGVWLVTDGFFTPDNPARGSWSMSFEIGRAHV